MFAVYFVISQLIDYKMVHIQFIHSFFFVFVFFPIFVFSIFVSHSLLYVKFNLFYTPIICKQTNNFLYNINNYLSFDLIAIGSMQRF